MFYCQKFMVLDYNICFFRLFLVNAEFPGVKDKPLMGFDYSTGNWSTP